MVLLASNWEDQFEICIQSLRPHVFSGGSPLLQECILSCHPQIVPTIQSRQGKTVYSLIRAQSSWGSFLVFVANTWRPTSSKITGLDSRFIMSMDFSCVFARSSSTCEWAANTNVFKEDWPLFSNTSYHQFLKNAGMAVLVPRSGPWRSWAFS